MPKIFVDVGFARVLVDVNFRILVDISFVKDTGR